MAEKSKEQKLLRSSVDKNQIDFTLPPCPTCNEAFEDTDAVIQCFKKCKRWFHWTCVTKGMNPSYRKLFHENFFVRWSCDRSDCKPKADKRKTSTEDGSEDNLRDED